MKKNKFKLINLDIPPMRIYLGEEGLKMWEQRWKEEAERHTKTKHNEKTKILQGGDNIQSFEYEREGV